MVAVATDGDGAVRMGSLDALPQAPAVRVGPQLGKLAFSSDGTKLFVTVRSSSYVAEVETRTKSVPCIPTDLHPSDVLVVGGRLTWRKPTLMRSARAKRNAACRCSWACRIIAFANALAAQGGAVFVSLGAANEIAVLSNGRVSARLPAGWYHRCDSVR